MSNVKNDFFNLVSPVFFNEGYKFLKSQNAFVKIVDQLAFRVAFKFDGRGGLSEIDWIDYSISVSDIEKILKATFKFSSSSSPCLEEQFNISRTSVKRNIPFIPFMYSQIVLDAANAMDLNKLSQMSYEEKYPPERIQNCANWVVGFFRGTIIPFFEEYNSLEEIYSVYSNESPIEGELNPLQIGRWASKELHFHKLMFVHLLCAKLNQPKPKIILEYTQHKQNTSSEMIALIEGIENYRF
jgi:hypothetical protein